ncbi:TetR/AcrR family transcriptional regulator [Gallaecimonas sp. GXIMD4217]|uniref:TetR/AcrR family transcriptional regulator n=1 Tax=Gallaecimonas sp. GXIMD4217 TaxID=3131927 RepID=UPI00311ACBAB
MRTASFDRDQVLTQAMQAFRLKGFNATTMADITRATGLHPGSLYGAFGNKRGLLLAAVDHYVDQRHQALEGCFQEVSLGQGLRNYLDGMLAELLCCDQLSCLLTKTLQELAENDEEIAAKLCQLLTGLEDRVVQAMERGLERGELPADAQVESLARFFLVGVYGLRTYAHTHPGEAALRDCAERLLASLPLKA